MSVPIRRLLPFSGIRAVFDRARLLEGQGREILHLTVGRPDHPLPPGAADGVSRALAEGYVHYIPNRGLAELRAALSDRTFEGTGRRFDPDTELVVTNGASEALAMAALALTGPGDEVVIPEPAWNHYRTCVELAGATPVSLPCDAAAGFAIDPDRLESLLGPRTRMIIVTSPSNPTGAVQPPAVLAAVARLAAARGIYVLTDEVYEHYVYDGPHHSIARSLGDYDRLIYINSLSKSYAMTGWRIGWIAAAPAVSDALNRVHQYLTVCGVAFAQRAAALALAHPGRPAYLADLATAFRARRQVWLDALDACPDVFLTPPGGAFYLFPRVAHRGLSGRELADYLLDVHGVAVVPGDVFGDDYRDFVRISYGGPLPLQQAAARKVAEVLRV